jgi:hypothetical protein
VLSVTAHARVTGPIVRTVFRQVVAAHGVPASMLTDNGMVFTTRLAGGPQRLRTSLRRGPDGRSIEAVTCVRLPAVASR